MFSSKPYQMAFVPFQALSTETLTFSIKKEVQSLWDWQKHTVHTLTVLTSMNKLNDTGMIHLSQKTSAN